MEEFYGVTMGVGVGGVGNRGKSAESGGGDAVLLKPRQNC